MDQGAQEMRLGEWRIEPQLNRVSRGAESHQLEPKTMDVLVYLLGRSGQVVSTPELIEHVWAGRVVEEANVQQHIRRIRQALGDNRKEPAYVETIPRRGYRLLMEPTPFQASESRPARHHAASPRAGRFWVTGAALALLTSGVFVTIWLRAPDSRPMDSSFLDTKSIAVARFDNLSTNPALEHFGAGLAEDIGTELSQFANLRVVESENGGPEFVMKGTIGELGSEVRLSVKLVRTRDMSTLWAETYDQPSEQVHDLRRSRSKNIAYMIRDMIVLDGIAGGLLDAGFEREAVDYYVRAQREYSDWTFGMGSNSDLRVTYLNRAIASAPDLYGAHFFLAISYSQRLGGTAWRDMRTRAHDALEELAALQPDIWLTSYAHGQISYQLDLDYAAAEGYFLEAADRLPEVASALLMPLIDNQIATMRLQQGRAHEALARYRVAASGGSHMDQPWMLRGQAQALILNSNYAEAVAVLDDAFAVTGRRADDITTEILLSKANACYLMGNNACANEVLDHAWSLYGRRRPEWFPGMMAALGRHDAARDLLAKAERLAVAGFYVDPAQMFSGYYQLGATDDAFVWLNRAIEERAGHLFSFLRSPQFYGDIRSDSRFRQAMDRLDEMEKWPHEIDSKGIVNEE